MVGVGAVRRFTAEKFGFHVAETLSVQVRPQQLEDLLRGLVGHQAEIDFGAGLGRQYGLGTWALVARSQPADCTGGLEHSRGAQFSAALQALEELFPDDFDPNIENIENLFLHMRIENGSLILSKKLLKMLNSVTFRHELLGELIHDGWGVSVPNGLAELGKVLDFDEQKALAKMT